MPCLCPAPDLSIVHDLLLAIVGPSAPKVLEVVFVILFSSALIPEPRECP